MLDLRFTLGCEATGKQGFSKSAMVSAKGLNLAVIRQGLMIKRKENSD